LARDDGVVGVYYLETERLVLREFTQGDVDNLVELDADPDVMHFINGGQPTPRENVEQVILPRWLRYYVESPGLGFWAAEEKVTGEFLGWFHFRPGEGHPADEPELGYRLHRSAWGKPAVDTRLIHRRDSGLERHVRGGLRLPGPAA